MRFGCQEGALLTKGPDDQAMTRRPNTSTNVSKGHNPSVSNPLAAAIAQALVGAGVGLVLPATALAQAEQATLPATKKDEEIEEILVIERQRKAYRVEESALSKLTESLRDTPQSISTLSGDILNERGVESLNDALRTVPGITLGAGEFSWQGANPNIRGFNGRDDMYLDGIRDFGSYPRDPFNLERIEILFGASSILFGRGSTGGAINQVTKRVTGDEITDLNVNVATNSTVRATADLERPVSLLGDGSAFRLNVLAHEGEVADRDGARAQRFGIAPTLSLGLGSATQLTLSYMKQTSDDRPDYGLPWVNGRPAPVPRQNFYGFDSDFLETDAGLFTAQLDHRFSDAVTLNAVARSANYSRRSRITEPLITQPVTPTTPPSDISVFRYVFLGDSDEAMLAGQAALTVRFQTGGTEHALVTGVEAYRENSNPVFAFGTGAVGTDLLNPVANVPFTGDTNPRVIADTTGTTLAIYALDTLKFDERWQVTAGIRWDRFDTDYDAVRFTGPPTPFNSGTASGSESFDRVDEVLSYRAALSYMPQEDIRIYLAGSTSFNPSAQSLSLLTTGRGLGTGNQELAPEDNRSIEVGIKADINDGTILLTGAIFQITKTNARVPDPNNPGFNVLGGKQRVRGISVDMNGMLTDKLYLSSGYTYLDSGVITAAPGSIAGAQLANAPEHSLSVWLNYQLTDRLDFGVGARYVSDQLAQNTGTGKSVSSYALFDAMGRYRLTDTILVKLNLTNLTDEYYFDQLHPWHVVPGPGPTATLAINASF